MTAGDARARVFEKLGSLFEEIQIATLTTVDDGGRLQGRPITTQRFDPEDGLLWFFTRLDSGKVVQIRRDQHVQLSYARPSENSYVCVSGQAEVVRDPALSRALWTEAYKSWFPGGPDDPNLGLVRVRIEAAEYWDAPENAWPLVAGFVAMRPQNEPETHGRVDLRDSS